MSGTNEVAETAAPNVQVNNEANQGQQAPRQTGWQMFQSIATRMLIMYFAMNAMSYFRSGGPKTSTTKAGGGTSSPSPSSTDLPGNLFSKGTKFVNFVLLNKKRNFVTLFYLFSF